MFVNYTSTLERFIENFKNNEQLANIVSEFRFGELQKRTDIYSSPAIYVTTKTSSFQTRESIGSALPDMDGLSLIQFEIGVVVSDKPTPDDTKKTLLEIIDIIIDELRSNPQLSNQEGNNPKFIRSVILSVEENQANRGKLIQDCIITVQGQVGNQITLTVPGVDIPLSIINKPVAREYVDYSAHLDTAGSLVGYAPTRKSNTRYYEIEDDHDNTLITLRKIKNDFIKNTYTVNNNGKESTFTGYLSGVNPGQNYDELSIVTLQFEVL